MNLQNAISKSEKPPFFNSNGMVEYDSYYLIYEDGTRVKVEDEIRIGYSYYGRQPSE